MVYLLQRSRYINLFRAVGKSLFAKWLLIIFCAPATFASEMAQAQYYYYPPPPGYYYPHQQPPQRQPQKTRPSEKKSKDQERDKDSNKRSKSDSEKSRKSGDSKDVTKKDKAESRKSNKQDAKPKKSSSISEAASSPRSNSVESAMPGVLRKSSYEVEESQQPSEDLPPAEDSANKSYRPYSVEPDQSPEPDQSSSSQAPVSGNFRTRVWANSDSLSKVAESAGLSSSKLLKLNNLKASELREGQAIKVPVQSSGESKVASAGSSPQMEREIWRGVRGSKKIALTFDAGADRDHAEELISNLKEAEAAATFFITGKFVKGNSDLIQSIASAGFPIHNHSWSHFQFTRISKSQIIQELKKMDEAIVAVTGKSTKPYWRPPFGERDSRVLETAAQEGYQSIYWTLDSLDSVDEPKSAEFVIDRVLNPPKSGDDPDHYLDGAIVLMHVGKQGTARAIPRIISELRRRGFKLVTVDEILKP